MRSRRGPAGEVSSLLEPSEGVVDVLGVGSCVLWYLAQVASSLVSGASVTSMARNTSSSARPVDPRGQVGRRLEQVIFGCHLSRWFSRTSDSRHSRSSERVVGQMPGAVVRAPDWNCVPKQAGTTI